MTANSAMILLYWDIGRLILERQERAGWGSRVIDRLAADLAEAYPEMKGLSPRNLKYMRAFAAAWPERSIVQEPTSSAPPIPGASARWSFRGPDEPLSLGSR
jgi:predicted nuclease of restriction endonuclease-like (RecB) superfamily